MEWKLKKNVDPNSFLMSFELALMFLESRLLKEQKEIQNQLIEKDQIIEDQNTALETIQRKLNLQNVPLCIHCKNAKAIEFRSSSVQTEELSIDNQKLVQRNREYLSSSESDEFNLNKCSISVGVRRSKRYTSKNSYRKYSKTKSNTETTSFLQNENEKLYNNSTNLYSTVPQDNNSLPYSNLVCNLNTKDSNFNNTSNNYSNALFSNDGERAGADLAESTLSAFNDSIRNNEKYTFDIDVNKMVTTEDWYESEDSDSTNSKPYIYGTDNPTPVLECVNQVRLEY
jgi:hypothetical protein